MSLVTISPVTANDEFTVLLSNRLLEVGESTHLAARDFTSMENVPGVSMTVTGDRPPASLVNEQSRGLSWSYNIQLFKDGDEVPINGFVDAVSVSDRKTCGCIRLKEMGKRISDYSERAILVTDQPGFNTTIYADPLIDPNKVPAVYMRLQHMDASSGRQVATLAFFFVKKSLYGKSSYIDVNSIDDASKSPTQIFVKVGESVNFPYIGEYTLEGIVPADKKHGTWVILVPTQ